MANAFCPFSSDSSCSFLEWIGQIRNNKMWYNKTFYKPLEKSSLILGLYGLTETMLFLEIILVIVLIFLNQLLEILDPLQYNSITNNFLQVINTGQIREMGR